MLGAVAAVATAGVLTIAGGSAAVAGSGATIDAGSVTPTALTGKVWLLTALLGKTPVRGTAITSQFATTGKVSGSSGCNLYGSAYRASGSTIRVVSPIATTLIACAPAVNVQERAFLKALSSARSYSVKGTGLTLRSAAGKAIISYKAQSQQLAGTSWLVLAYNNGKQGFVSVVGETTLTAVFGKSGTLTGFAGCNDYNAAYTATAPKISIGPVASTRKHCAQPAGVMEQESQYLMALQTAATYRIEGTRLEMRTAAGALAAEFQRK